MYLVIRNTETLPELGYWSSIDTFNKVNFMVIFYLWQGKTNNISCHDIRLYTYVHIMIYVHMVT